MKLLRKDTGVPFIDPVTSGVYPYKFLSTVDAGWFDITGIENTHLFGIYAADYVRATKEMWVLFNAKTGATEVDKWANCTTGEKNDLSIRHIVSQILRLEIFTSEVDIFNFQEHAQESIETRQIRIDKGTISIGYMLPNPEDRADLFLSLGVYIEAFVKVNDKEIHDWMHSTGSHTAGGFKAKSYWSQNIEDTYTIIVENGEKLI